MKRDIWLGVCGKWSQTDAICFQINEGVTRGTSVHLVHLDGEEGRKAWTVVPGSVSSKPLVSSLFDHLSERLEESSDTECFLGLMNSDCILTSELVDHLLRESDTSCYCVSRVELLPGRKQGETTFLDCPTNGFDLFVMSRRFWRDHRELFRKTADIFAEPFWDNAYATLCKLNGKTEFLNKHPLLYHWMHEQSWKWNSLEARYNLQVFRDAGDAPYWLQYASEVLQSRQRTGSIHRQAELKEEARIFNKGNKPSPQFRDLPDLPPPDGKKRIVSFSLWKSSETTFPMYRSGVLANLELAKKWYPGWTIRVYVNETVPVSDQNLFSQLGGEVVVVNKTAGVLGTYPGAGLFWRMLPYDDADCEALIVRDTDSRLGEREAWAVQDWLASGQVAMTMHDHPQHLGMPMLGGMWGIRPDQHRGLKMTEAVTTWLESQACLGEVAGNWKMQDQLFLWNIVYPKVAVSLVDYCDFVSGPGIRRFGVDRTEKLRFVGEIFDANGKPCAEHRYQLEAYLNGLI